MDIKNTMGIGIYLLRQNETIYYAAQELCKYLSVMSGNKESIAINKNCIRDDGLQLGLSEDFGIEIAGVMNSEKDDAIYVNVRNSKGIIAGSNPRSVLFAVYRFLETNGCKWIRPGKDGEIIPSRDVHSLEASISDKAYYRYRGNNNCGAFSLEHYLDKIEWLPKVGLNTFFNEFFLPKELYNNWYRHEYKSLKQPEQHSDIELLAYNEKVVKEIKKRGLIYQTAGHGWTGAFYGLSGVQTEDKESFDKKAEQEIQFIAQVNGKRETNISGPRFTELCYGNPEVRERMANCISDYAEEHTEVDLLHFWLSDSMNAHCECDLCIHTRPSDFYVMILNAIDEKFTSRGIKTRVVFLIYQDLLWAPEKEKIKNPDRFVMMFAPIRRKYDQPYDFEGDESSLGNFNYNKNLQPSTIRGFIASLKNWQKIFTGEAFSFDYHMTWYHYFDYGYYGFARIMTEDIKRLKAIGLCGFVSCQIMRTSFPTGFPLYVHAKYLWNPEENFDNLALLYFESAFGQDGSLCKEYLKKLSELFAPDYFYLNPERLGTIATSDSVNRLLVKNNLSKISEVIEKFRPIIENNIKCEEPSQSHSWEYLFIHAELALLMANALRSLIEGRQYAANKYWTKVIEYIMTNENRLETVFDPLWFFYYYERIKLFDSLYIF